MVRVDVRDVRRPVVRMGVVGSGTNLYRACALSAEPPKSAYLRRVEDASVVREDELADLELQPSFAHGG